MLLATTINLAILFHMSGREEEWMCFMFCTLDGRYCYLGRFNTMLILHEVTVGIVALHYVTNHPAEKQLGVKELPFSHRNPNTSNTYCGTEYGTSIYPNRTAQARVWTGDWYNDEEVITAPDRIFVSTSYEVGTLLAFHSSRFLCQKIT
jgi:hypothetical protein